MQVRNFKGLLARISGALGAAKAADAQAAVQSLNNALDGLEESTVEQVASAIEAPAPDAVTIFSRQLDEVSLDEPRFLTILAQIKQAKLKKAELQQLVKCYVGRVDSKMTGPQLIDRIKLEFYERMYEASSHKLAVRATPF